MSGCLPISVVIPSFNREAMVAGAVASALGQRPLPPAEVIVVDDHSSDASAAVAEAAGARVLRHEVNRGGGAARNTGIAAATSEWVALLDSDDEWLPGHLHRLWSHRAGGYVLVGAGTVGHRSRRLLGNPTRAPVVVSSPAQLLFPDNLIAANAVMLRRDAVVEAGGFGSARYAHDLDLWLRLLEIGPALVLPEVGAWYREHAGQTVASRAGERASVASMIESYADRPWNTPRLRDRVRTVQVWDELREHQRSGAWQEAARCAWWLARPARVAALGRMWGFRRLLRRAGSPTRFSLDPPWPPDRAVPV